MINFDHVLVFDDRPLQIELFNLTRKTKKKKSRITSLSGDHRLRKTAIHTTVNGLGRVARLRLKK